MPRPRIVDPKGRTRMFSVLVSEPMHESLKKEAKKRGITVSELAREKLAEAS